MPHADHFDVLRKIDVMDEMLFEAFERQEAQRRWQVGRVFCMAGGADGRMTGDGV